MDPDMKDLGCNGQNLAVYYCEFLEMLRRVEKTA
jgi:hypothetical protein